MARYGETGAFTPTEAAYVGPGDFERAVLGEAVKRGTYLSQMDQFYAQLEEMEREFEGRLALEEKKLGFEERRWGEELAWLKEQEAGRLGVEREKIGAEKYKTRLAYGKTDAEKRREAAGMFATPTTRAAEGMVPLSWMTEQIGKLYPEAETSPDYGSQVTREIYFSNPTLGTQERI